MKFNKRYIYDIFHSDVNKLVIIMPADITPPRIRYINSTNTIKFNLHICPHRHTLVYESKFKTKYIKKIKLLINGKILNINVNKYPIFKDEIIMSTMVYNEDNYIRQWIKYHSNIGVKRFIIYDNSKINDNKSYKSVEKSSNLKKVLKDLIKKRKVVLIEWSYPKRSRKSGISGQTTQQNHSIYAFRSSKYIGLFDIDEYVNMQKKKNINSFFNSFIKHKNIDINNIGGFRILNRSFNNPKNLSTKDYDFLFIFNCEKIRKKGKEKNFVIPKNVKTYSVHKITHGKLIKQIDSKYIYFNHYIFLNKLNRGMKKVYSQDKSILKHCKFIEKNKYY